MRELQEILSGGVAEVRPQDGAVEQALDLRQLLTAAAQRTASRAISHLEGLQTQEGYWVGDLTADATLPANYILLQAWLYPAEGDAAWTPPTLRRVQKAVEVILASQRADGGWNIYEPGPSEINATVLAYTALKLTGLDPDDERMRRARALILRMGGVQECNSYTRINLSFFDLFPRKFCPTIPPEVMLIPGNVLYEMSSWTRTIIVPLSIVQSLSEPRPTPGGRRVDEIFHPSRRLALHRKDRITNVFVQADKLLKRWERQNVKAIRGRAIAAAENWMLARLQHSEGLGAIYPSIQYSIMAMVALGYERDHPDLEKAIRDFDNLIVERDGELVFQPCWSPVWDTAIAGFALGEQEAGMANAQKLTEAADWLLTREIRRKGDWSAKRPDLTPSGWVFEFANEYYPDIDDTAMVLLTLMHAKASDPARQERAERRAIHWLFGMQSSDGGWAAFDVDNNWKILNQIPFADHNAMLDPTCADITGRVLEALCRRGYTTEHPAIAAGVQYLLKVQESDGSWYGRWGVNYVYGTFLALRGLAAAHTPDAVDAISRGANWLRMAQNPDGGWGESCLGYTTNRFECAQSTPSQTAWALLGLMAAGAVHTQSVAEGIRWLVENQKADGSWEEKITTGTGFPRVFYIRYDLYRNYFPLLALGRYQKLANS